MLLGTLQKHLPGYFDTRTPKWRIAHCPLIILGVKIKYKIYYTRSLGTSSLVAQLDDLCIVIWISVMIIFFTTQITSNFPTNDDSVLAYGQLYGHSMDTLWTDQWTEYLEDRF